MKVAGVSFNARCGAQHHPAFAGAYRSQDEPTRMVVPLPSGTSQRRARAWANDKAEHLMTFAWSAPAVEREHHIIIVP
jgi:hypothetical protein